jgi:hypothetical protein
MVKDNEALPKQREFVRILISKRGNDEEQISVIPEKKSLASSLVGCITHHVLIRCGLQSEWRAG